jgi:hypothetical protein
MIGSERQTDPQIESMAIRLASLESVIANLLAGRSSSLSVPQATTDPAPESKQISRRKLLTGVAASAVGAGTLLMRAAPQAVAATGGNLILGSANDANTSTILSNSSSSAPSPLLSLTNMAERAITAVAGTNFDGVTGTSSAGASGAGVSGVSASGYGVYGDSTSGYALFAGGNGRFGLNAHLAMGSPVSGTYAKGDIVRDTNAAVFICVVSGTPGTWKKVVGPDSSSLHLIPPARMVDTFSGVGLAVGAFSGPRLVNFRTAPIPPSAIGILASLTTYAPSGLFGASGGASVAPAGAASGINTNSWGPDDGTSNGFAVTSLSSGGLLQIYTSSTVYVTVDVAGYLT